MNEERNSSVLGGILRRGYAAVFEENWPIWLGGVLLGIMSIITFAWARPWGVAGGLRNWGDWFFNLVGLYSRQPESPWISTNSILTLGLLWGAFSSALLSRQFAIRMAPPLEIVKGIVGGTFMGVGAAMAGGCNVGGFYSALSALSFSGIAMMVGLLVGAYLGLRYLYWELEHLPSGAGGGGALSEKSEGGFNLRDLEPYAGVLVLLAAVAVAWGYSLQAYTRVGGLLLCGIAFGIIIQRTRFCFVRGFRDPFMTGDAEVPRAIAISLMISILGFAALKWSGLRGEMVYVSRAFWFGGLVGGIVFGTGMVVAGGCGSGSVWRAGEGHVKLMIAVVCFCLSTSLFKAWIRSSEALTAFMGNRVFLPDYLSYKGTVIILFFILIVYYLTATWNEETDRFTVEI
ncbi:MAG: YeeE/YedE family protein [Deltaproteobacteria bacterium]|nr:YeeE/YedE family protein [Deltaproteobacteria bacterium]